MSKRSIRKSIVMLLAFVLMSASTALTAFAAGPSPTPDQNSKTIQQASSSTGTVTLGKILTANQPDKFPLAQDFIYTITPVEAWDNANTSTAQSGATIAAANMPMPATVTTEHHSVTANGTTATVRVGNFQDASDTSRSTGDGVDSSTLRTRSTPVRITFNKAGYYVYKVKETGSDPANVPGVDYDEHEYFMVFYVCNRVDENGNTIDGVYVHDITSYRNNKGSEAYKPTLTDIQNVTDNNDVAANTNNEGNLSKVGKSTTADPDELEAYRMWNHQYTQDLVLKKNVTGNLGDRTKLFEYTIAFTGLEPSQKYTTNVAAKYSGDATTAGKTFDSATVGTLADSNTSFTATVEGAATVEVKLSDDQVLVINALPVTAKYTITEAASDHVASYVLSSAGPSDTTDPIHTDYSAGTDDSGQSTSRFVSTSAANSASDTALTTGNETVEKKDGTVTVLYKNNRDIATITGIPGLDYIIYAAAAAIVVLIAYLIIRRRREYDDEI